MSEWVQTALWVFFIGLVFLLVWRRDRILRMWFRRNKTRLSLDAYFRVYGAGSAFRFLAWPSMLSGVAVAWHVWQTPLLMILLLCVCIGGLVDLWFLRNARRRRLLDSIRAARFRACPCCLYSLTGLGRSGRCPECGESYDVSKLEEIWQELLATDKQSHVETGGRGGDN